MPRVKKATIAIKRRRKVLKQAKGFRHGRGSKERLARESLLHAGRHALAHRRTKKNDFRRLWNIQVNAGVRPLGLSYSRLIDAMKKKNVIIDRKILALLARKQPAAFSQLVEFVK